MQLVATNTTQARHKSHATNVTHTTHTTQCNSRNSRYLEYVPILSMLFFLLAGKEWELSIWRRPDWSQYQLPVTVPVCTLSELSRVRLEAADSSDIALIYPPPFLTQLSKCPGRRKRLKLTHSSLETIFNFLPQGEMNRQRGECPNTSLLLFHWQQNCSSNMKNSI